MSAKDFLKKMMYIDYMIDCKIEQLTELRNRLTSIGGMGDGERVQSSKSPDKLTDSIAKIIELEKVINADIDKLIDYKSKAREMIELLDSDIEKVILYKRYFDKKSFEQIATECNYSWRWIHKLHSSALQNLNKIMN